MSAFNFIDNDTFGDEFADQSQSSDITFGSTDDIVLDAKPDSLPNSENTTKGEISLHSTQPKKTGSRVIGKMNQKNSKKPKTESNTKSTSFSRFAKKNQQGALPSFAISKPSNDSSPHDSPFSNNLSLNNNNESFLSATSSDTGPILPENPPPKSNDLSNPSSNAETNEKSKEDGFSFLNTDTDSKSAFDFANTPTTLSSDNASKGFDFINSTNSENATNQPQNASFSDQHPQSILEAENPFRSNKTCIHVSSTDNPFSQSNKKKENSLKKVFTSKSETTEKNDNTINQSSSLDFEDPNDAYIKQFEKYNKRAHTFYETIQNLEQQIVQLKKSHADALSNKMVEHAHQISFQINSVHSKILDSYNGLSTALECALNLANDAPKLMNKHSISIQKEIPQLNVRRSAMMKRMALLGDLQENDKQTLEDEKSKIASALKELKSPLTEHKKKFNERKDKFNAKIREVERPFQEKIELLNEEKNSHNKRIAELMAEITSHQNAIKGINNRIIEEENLMKKELEAYSSEQRAVKNDEQLLQNEEKRVAQKQKELEAPFNTLLQTVEKRDEEMANLSYVLDKTEHELHEAEQDVDEMQSASAIILEVCSHHAEFKISRSQVRTTFDAANKSSIDAELRLNQIHMEISGLLNEKAQVSKKIEEAQSQIPQLEASKKAYIASKNFKGAQQVANSLKEHQNTLAAYNQSIEKASTRLEELDKEEKEIKANSAKFDADVEETKSQLDKTDYAFYCTASDLLVALCKSSPFADKLLSSLTELVCFARDITRPPKELTKEELEEKLKDLNLMLNQSISEENFDEADDLQNQIDKITVKLQRLGENTNL